MQWPDWEDLNKLAFWQCVHLWLTKADVSADEAIRILHEAQRVKKTELPMDLYSATLEFIDWQVRGGSRPSWVKHANGPGIA